MRILITGGAGFIGSYIAEKFLEHNKEVYIIDDLSTGSLDNIRHLQNRTKFKEKLFITIDTILNDRIMSDLVEKCDAIIHMAAAVGVKYILENPLSSIVTNIKGTEKLLHLCNKFRKKVLLASTSEVYGKHTHAPLVETDNIIFGPSTKFRWSYAASKLIDEFTALAYFRTNQLPVIILRLFNIVGPRQTGRYGMVIPRFVQQALKNESITVYGNGSQTRTFTYVEDLSAAVPALLDSEAAIGEVINIGGVEEVSIKYLAQRIKKLTHSRSEIKFIPYDEAFAKDFEDMQRRVPSIEKIKNLIDWRPTTNLDMMLGKVIEYYRSF